MTTRVSIAFVVRGKTLDHNRITDIIGLEPTDVWSPGDIVPRTAIRLRNAGWSYKLGPEESDSFADLLERMIVKLTPRVSAVRQVREELAASIDLSFQALVEDVQPYLRLEPATLRLLGAAEITVESDFIPIAPEEADVSAGC